MDCGFFQYIADIKMRLQYIVTFLQYISDSKIQLQYITTKITIQNTDCNDNSNPNHLFCCKCNNNKNLLHLQ